MLRQDPCEYQWQLENDELLPVKNILLIPEEIRITCSCKQDDISNRCGGVCKCSRKGVKCTAMCGCQKTCANSPNAPMRPPKRKEPAKKLRRTRQKQTSLFVTVFIEIYELDHFLDRVSTQFA